MESHRMTLTCAAGALLAAMAAATPAFAQGAIKPLEAVIVNPDTRPVPVADKALLDAIKALSEAGARTPYQHAIYFNQGTTTCTTFVCRVTFPAVPTGKRLVVTHASARFGLPVGNQFAEVMLSDSTFNAQGPLLPAPVSTGPGTFVASSPITYYVEAGRSPVLQLQGINIAFASLTATAAVVGHLVDAP